MLTLIEYVENTGKSKSRPNGYISGLYKCDCGKEKIIQERSIKLGRTKSCGCKNIEYLKNHKKHGMHKTRIYQIWTDIKQRCNNEKWSRYDRYGGRGITYDKKWETFEGFYEDMKEGYNDNLTIDRIDVNGNYCKENCKWSTRIEQMNNTTFNKFLTYNNKTQTVTQWANELGINRDKIYARLLKLNWSTERTLSTK